MKAVVYISVLILLVGCSSNDQLEQCKSDNAALQAEKSRQDSLLSTFSKTYSEIDSVSADIARRRSLINEMAQGGRLSEKDKTAILAQMDTINMLVAQNKQKVSSLQGNLSDGGLEAGFRYMVKSMDDKNLKEDDQNDDMKADLARVSKDFSDLFEEYVYKEVENMEMQEELNRQKAELDQAKEKLDQAKEKLLSGYYVIGTKEELTSKGLIYKRGFFDNKEVNEDFDKSQFKKVNIHDFKEILLDARKVEIVTTHPSESYEIKGIKKKVDKLVIKDHDLFWSVSKFLIIEIED